MKNTTKIIGLLLFVAIIGFSFSACEDEDNSPKDALDGTTWEDNEISGYEAVIKFKSPNFDWSYKTVGLIGYSGTYSISGNRVTLTDEIYGSMSGTLSGNTLTITRTLTAGTATVVFTKK